MNLASQKPLTVLDMDDIRFRIKPHQQILSSCTGALLTSVMSKYLGATARQLVV